MISTLKQAQRPSAPDPAAALQSEEQQYASMLRQAGVPVCSFGLAVNRVRSRSEEVDFFDVSAWRELGQTIADYKKKGDPILVEGRLQYRTWEAQDGSKRSKVDVVADNVQFLGRRGGAEEEDEVSSGGPA